MQFPQIVAIALAGAVLPAGSQAIACRKGNVGPVVAYAPKYVSDLYFKTITSGVVYGEKRRKARRKAKNQWERAARRKMRALERRHNYTFMAEGRSLTWRKASHKGIQCNKVSKHQRNPSCINSYFQVSRGGSSRRAALRAARSAWSAGVISRHGRNYGDWDLSVRQKKNCKKNKLRVRLPGQPKQPKWNCSVFAYPCSEPPRKFWCRATAMVCQGGVPVSNE